MAVCYILDFAGGDAAAYDRVIERMKLDGRMAPGGLFHAAGPHSNGWRVIDVWESDDAFQGFAADKIGPITRDEGLPEPSITRVEIHRMIDERDGGQPIRFLQVVRLPGLDAETFDSKDSEIRQGGVPNGLVFHVNGPAEDGWLVADGWTDKGIRDEFMAGRVVPIMRDAVSGPPDVQEMQVHNTLAAPARTAGAA